MSDTEDEDVKRAIALSLQPNSSPLATSMPNAVIDLTSSDEDDDLDAPVRIKAPKPSNHPPKKQERRISIVELSDDEQKTTATKDENDMKSLPPASIEPPVQVSDTFAKAQPPSGSPGILGLDRKQMEAERLARAQQKKRRGEEQLSALDDSRKRKASISETLPGTQDGRQVKAKFWESIQTTKQHPGDQNPIFQSAPAPASGGQTKDAPLTQGSHSLAIRQPLPAPCPPLKAATQPDAPNVLSYKQQQVLQASGVQYPDGVVKKTWVKGCPREDDIKIEELFQKDDLELAVLSTFQVDPDWVAEKILETTKVIWVLQAKDEKEVS